MNRLTVVLFLVASGVTSICASDAQNTYGFQCVVSTPACSASLRANTTTGLFVASVAGYRSAGDAGGGEFYDLGAAGTSRCNRYSGGYSNPINQPSTIDLNTQTLGLTVGEAISGGGIQPDTEIASVVSTSPTVITTTLPTAGTGGASISITGDNAGTVIIDSEATPQCWQKTNYRGEPHEWGAKGDGNTDDTTALQNWLGAYGNVSNLAPGTAPPNFGPWIATIPANYLVSQPLVCPAFANLQAGANIAAGTPNNGGGPSSPIVRILAVAPNPLTVIPTFTDTQGLPALMMASQYCRISGIALDVNGNGDYIFPGLSGSTIQNSSTVTLQSSAPQQVVPGMPLNDGGNCIPKGTVITAANGTNITMSVAASGTCGSGGLGDAITITGFYGVDVVGTHVGIDSHTLVERGFHNVHCADTQLDGLQLKDSQFLKSWDTGVYLTANCNGTRVIGDIISASGQGFPATGITGAGLSFSGPDLSLESGIVEQSEKNDAYLLNLNTTPSLSLPPCVVVP